MKFSPYKSGISISSLQKWIVDRERYRIYAVDGLIVREEYNHRTSFGNYVGKALETYGETADLKASIIALREEAAYDKGQFLSSEWEIDHWTKIAIITFKCYVDHYADFYAEWIPYAQELEFNETVTLPDSDRTITLHGYIDEVFKHSTNKSCKLQETKCRERIDEDQILLELHQDLQTMVYWYAFTRRFKHTADLRYNVIRRCGLRKTKSEKLPAFYKRVETDIVARPENYFLPFNVTITTADLTNFLTNCLYPLLEDFLDWYDRIARGDYSRNWRRPFGVYDALSLGQRGDYFDYMTTGNRSSLIPKPPSRRT